MSGKLPIDRVRAAQDAPSVYEDHRERFAEKQAKLAQTNDLAEGERPPQSQAPSVGPTMQPEGPGEAETEAQEPSRPAAADGAARDPTEDAPREARPGDAAGADRAGR